MARTLGSSYIYLHSTVSNLELINFEPFPHAVKAEQREMNIVASTSEPINYN